jgi:hypothetical protein
MKERKHKEWKAYGKTFFPLFGCFVRVERKYLFGGTHVQKLSTPGSKERWACSLGTVKLQNGPDLNQNITMACH